MLSLEEQLLESNDISPKSITSPTVWSSLNYPLWVWTFHLLDRSSQWICLELNLHHPLGTIDLVIAGFEA